jgi:hypothetical protein
MDRKMRKNRMGNITTYKYSRNLPGIQTYIDKQFLPWRHPCIVNT